MFQKRKVEGDIEHTSKKSRKEELKEVKESKETKEVKEAVTVRFVESDETEVKWQLVDYLQQQIKAQDFGGLSFWHNLRHVLEYADQGFIGAFSANGKLVGFLVGPSYSCPSVNVGNTIEFIEVLPTYRHCGIGRRLVKEAERLISHGGFYNMKSSHYDGEFNTPVVRVPSVQEDAVGFWTALGYQNMRYAWYHVIGCSPRNDGKMASNVEIITIELAFTHRKFKENGMDQKRTYHIYNSWYNWQELYICPNLARTTYITQAVDKDEFTITLLDPVYKETQLCDALIVADVIVDTQRRTSAGLKVCKYSEATLKKLTL